MNGRLSSQNSGARTETRAATCAPGGITVARPLTRKRCSLGSSGGPYTRHSLLWPELKRLAPEKAAKLNCTQVSTEQPEPMVEEAKNAK